MHPLMVLFIFLFIYLLTLFNVEKTIDTSTNLYRQKKKKKEINNDNK